MRIDLEVSDTFDERESLFKRLELNWKVLLKHISLFILTFISVSFSATQFFFSLEESILFASLLLLFLTTHEFGHYIAAVIHKVSTTLPFFIPLPILSPIGTMGAVIRIKQRIQTTKKLYDIGISGPIAGFIVSLMLLFIGFATLPSPDYALTFEGHQDLKAYVQTYGDYPDQPFMNEEGAVLMLGNTLLFSFLAQFFDHVPPMWELYHFPFLFAGWLGLLFTALNLTPIGQLDGGHILYSLIGYRNHQTVARLLFGVLSVLGGIGTIPLITETLQDIDPVYGFYSWAIWGLLLFSLLQRAFHRNVNWTIYTCTASLIITFILINLFQADDWNGFTSWAIWMVFIIAFVKIEHPPVIYEQKLDSTRRTLGWLSMAIFVLCISPNPLYFKSF